MKKVQWLVLRIILVFIWNIFCLNVAKCQTSDTTIYYFKYTQQNAIQVSSLAEADYFRVVLPPDSNDRNPNIREFYSNGKIKLIGKMLSGVILSSPKLYLTGDCQAYFPNGKKQIITHYVNGIIIGDEYLFYPNGTIYCHRKHSMDFRSEKILFWDCYDTRGNQICKDGNGMWISYKNAGLTDIQLTGVVKNGKMEGEWRGYTNRPDSIRYSYFYKNGELIKSMGYDKSGQAYPFKWEKANAYYKNGVPAFIQSVRNHLKWPRDTDGKKIQIDTMHVSFVIEKNGQLSQFEVLGSIKQNVKDALIAALEQCSEWTPASYYGLPFRTQIILPLKYFHSYVYDKDFVTPVPLLDQQPNESNAYEISVLFKERMLDF